MENGRFEGGGGEGVPRTGKVGSAWAKRSVMEPRREWAPTMLASTWGWGGMWPSLTASRLCSDFICTNSHASAGDIFGAGIEWTVLSRAPGKTPVLWDWREARPVEEGHTCKHHSS